LDGNFVLYGKESRPSTWLLLKPGDAVRLVGAAPVTLVPAGAATDPWAIRFEIASGKGHNERLLHEAGYAVPTKENAAERKASNSPGTYKSSNSIAVEVVK